MGFKGDLDDENRIASESLMKRMNQAGDGAICYMLSRIYFSTDDEDIRTECRKATYCAKRMGKKLGEYKAEKLRREQSEKLAKRRKKRGET